MPQSLRSRRKPAQPTPKLHFGVGSPKGPCPEKYGGSEKPVRGTNTTNNRENKRTKAAGTPNFKVYKGQGGRRFVYKTTKNGKTQRVYVDIRK